MPASARERALQALARRQHGVVTARQLADLGFGRGAVAHRAAQGRLERLHRGVYLAGPLEAPLTRAMAAVLACGPGAVLSHLAAAALWELYEPRPGDDVDVTLAGRRIGRRRGIRVHHAATADATSRHAIPVTTPERTLLDLAAALPARELERAVEEAQIRRLTSHARLAAALRLHAGRPGTPALRAALRTEPALTRSEAERRALELIRAAQLPAPEANARLLGHEVDLLWPAHRLVVEVDGHRYHGTRGAFERDRERDARLQAQGYRVMRVTWRQLRREREAVVARLAAALALRPPGPGRGRSSPAARSAGRP